jgi:hypothetical protein
LAMRDATRIETIIANSFPNVALHRT